MEGHAGVENRGRGLRFEIREGEGGGTPDVGCRNCGCGGPG